jgi:MFS family permease
VGAPPEKAGSPGAPCYAPSAMLASLRKRIPDDNVWLVYAATLVVGFGYGMSVSVLGLFLDQRGFSKTDVGNLAVWFALGIVLLSLPMGPITRRFSAKRTLVACLAGYAVTVALFPHLPTFASIAPVRFLDGAFSVGVWVASEMTLLARARDEDKAFATSLYAIAMAMGYVVGPLLAKLVLVFAPMEVVFEMAGVLALLSCLLVAWRLDPDPPAMHAAPENKGEGGAEGEGPSTAVILWSIKTSCFATFCYGYFQATAVLFLPIYLVGDKGVAPEDTILVTALFALGMLLFANPAGRLGDRLGHLSVMRGLGLVGLGAVVTFVYVHAFAALGAAVFVAGATLAAISPVSLALQGVITEKRNLHRAGALYNVFYAAGMLLGPPLSSRIYDAWGGSVMLLHIAVLWAAFVVFTVVYRSDDPRTRAA